MPRVSDLLDKFRPAGAPGPAGTVGVPGDRRAAAEAELAPVFAAIEDVERVCARLRNSSRSAADERIRTGTAEAELLIARAHQDAEAERAAAAARVRGPAADELAAIHAQAEKAADLVRRRAAERLPRLVAKVTAHVRAQLLALGQEVERPTARAPSRSRR